MRSVLVVMLLVAVAAASRRDWVGTAKCGSCHPAELAAWQTTPHATTRARFTARPQTSCLACHGTGDAPAGPNSAGGVGCEACHGAGAGYAEDDIMRDRPVALALGLVDTASARPQAEREKARATICATCHARRTTSKPFDPNAPV